MSASEDASEENPVGIDMSMLASRIEALQSLPEPERVRLFDLDSMVPRQVLEVQQRPISNSECGGCHASLTTCSTSE